MKILIVHQYFNTPESGGPLRSYYLAHGMKSNGYEVEVITSHNQKTPLEEEIQGIKVHYLPVYYDNSLRFLPRIIAFIKFARLAYQKALLIKGVDLCYAISTPLTVGWVAGKLKATQGIPYIFEVGDLWPEAPIQMGVIKSPWIIGKIKRFEKSIYEGADRVVALSPGIKESILKTTPNCQVSIIPNMSDCQFFQMETKDSQLERRFGVKDKIVITYFGAAGRANHLEYLLEAARHAKNAGNTLHFLVVAQGSELKRIKKLAAQYKLSNLDFLPYGNRGRLKELLNVTDAVYVSYADVPVLATGSPNKYFDGLAAGKLMLINFKGWLKNITESHELGFYVDPTRPEVVSELMGPIALNRANLLKSQKKARAIAETYFSRELAVQKLLKSIDNEHQMVVKGFEVYTLTA
jgi:glycosyltransferase involved in cell wall biosynthesis